MKNLYIIIILYNPTDEQLSHLKKLASSYNIVVVDNSDRSSFPQDGLGESISYLPLMHNCGIAKAQNIGIRKCIDLHAEYVFFLDQDTIIDIEVPIELLDSLILLQKRNDRIIAIGPSIRNMDSNTNYKSARLNLVEGRYAVCSTLISSGMLVDISAFKHVGCMDESLFIDYVDHEWCWRASMKGYICCVDLLVQINHRVGKRTVNLLGIPFIISSPKRYYYQYRNSFMLMKRNYVPMKWKIKACVRNLVELFVIPWLSSSPFQVLKYMFSGLYSIVRNLY